MALSKVLERTILAAASPGAAPRPLGQRLRHAGIQEIVDASEDGVIGAAAQPAPFLVRGAQSQVRRLFELERVIALDARSACRQLARHPDRLERLLFDVVRFFRVQGEDLERHIGVGHEQPDDRSCAELFHRL